jgi:hypothetical protein
MTKPTIGIAGVNFPLSEYMTYLANDHFPGDDLAEEEVPSPPGFFRFLSDELYRLGVYPPEFYFNIVARRDDTVDDCGD